MSLTPDQIADIAARTGQPPEFVEKAALALPTVLHAFLTAARALLSAPFMNHVSEQAEALLQLIPEDQRPALLHVAVALAWASASQDGAASPTLDPMALLSRARTFAFCDGHIVVKPRADWARDVALDPTQQVDVRGPVWVIANRREVYLLGEDGQFHSKAPALRMPRDAALMRAAAIERCWTEANARAESNTPQPVVEGRCPRCGLDGCVPGAE